MIKIPRCKYCNKNVFICIRPNPGQKLTKSSANKVLKKYGWDKCPKCGKKIKW